VDGLAVKNGNLIVKTSIGEVSELRPYCYQLDGKGKVDIDAKYVIDGNTVRFKISNYSKSATLIIDPTLIFASFTRSVSDNWGYTATYDGSGNFYAGGIAFANGYPVSDGAFQQSFGGGVDDGPLPGGYDIALIKLNPNGTSRLYGTYIGGSGNEQPHSLVVDHQGNLVIAGRTNSSNFPTTTATFGPGGGHDIFLAVMNSTGTALIGSRKIGGSRDDGVNIRSKELGGPLSITRNYGDDARSEVIVDGNNNIYLVSCTQSPDYPTTPGAFQGSLGGQQDGVVIKATNNLSNILLSSFLGGTGDDAAFVLALNPTDNNIYVAGATTSKDLKGIGSLNSPPLYNSFRGGVCDGFVSIINNNGSSLIRTTYVSSAANNSDDLVYGIEFDRKGFPYITGTTTVAFPLVGNPAFNTQATGKQFITKMQPLLNGVVYSTNFGKSGYSVPDISPTAFLVDRCENVYVAGWGGGINSGSGYPNAGTLGMHTTANAIRPTSDGSDFYFFILEKNALSQLYGTFYGNIDLTADVGDHVDGGTSRYDSEGIIYEALCANCGQVGNFPTSPPGVWGPSNPSQTGAHCNEAMLKIAFEFAGVGSGIRSSIAGIPRDTSGCVPLTVDFTDTIANGKKYIWSFGDGAPDTSTTTASASHTFNSVGRFRVRLISIDSATCNIADTSYLNIKVGDNKASVSLTAVKLDPCEALLYQFNNTSVAPPALPFSAGSFEWSFGDGATLISNAPSVTHSYAAPGTYNVALRLIDTGYCNYPDSATLVLRVASNVDALFETPASGCVPYNAIFTNTSIGGSQFTWNFGDGSTSTEENPIHLYSIPGTYTIKMVATDPNTCNKIDSTQQTIVVSASPTAAFTYSPQVPKENQEYTFTNFSRAAVLYKWDFGDGDTIVTTKLDTTIKHTFNATATFNVCLTAYNEYGCDSTVCTPISAIIIPLVDVPNAFTPNGDGTNDFVRVRGFGISKMDWRVYNRWGTIVFHSSSLKETWDGRYNGAIQPQEVYVYVLDVTFSDGTKYRKTGDITLLR
jgi:gliding motility-associated-like protein